MKSQFPNHNAQNLPADRQVPDNSSKQMVLLSIQLQSLFHFTVRILKGAAT